MLTITIKEGKDKLLLKHHPWVFSGAIAKIEGEGAGAGAFVGEGAGLPGEEVLAVVLEEAGEGDAEDGGVDAVADVDGDGQGGIHPLVHLFKELQHGSTVILSECGAGEHSFCAFMMK